MPGRRIVVVRHGERVDFTFTDEWIKTCFSDNNIYIRHNMNMPDSVPRRERPNSFLRDSPLTKIGEYQATLVGKCLLEEKVLRDGFQVFVSPALRCVQTADAIGKGMNMNFSLKVEPGLFEWMAWFRDFMPTFMTGEELRENGFNVDPNYTTFLGLKDEEVDEFYERSYILIQHLLSSTDKDILLVAHGVSLDTITRQLSGQPIRSLGDMMRVLRGVPYCGTAVAELHETAKKWSLISVPQITLKHGGAHDFDASKALSEGL